MAQHPTQPRAFTSPTTRAVVEAFFARQRAGDHTGLLDLFADRVDFFAPGAANAGALGPGSTRSDISLFFSTLGKVLVPDRDFLVLGQDAVVTGFARCDTSLNPIAMHFTVVGAKIGRCHLTEVSTRL
ncbi:MULTISPECIES: nuclear transport factor 2 family protein [unclassified Streptomyces]|uniref:SnoaL-like domain-containing protein n=1 Tax=Streptomyces sp. NBC_00060 TaxID=2975636 RepID=A0AAU2H4I6_9ACTN